MLASSVVVAGSSLGGPRLQARHASQLTQGPPVDIKVHVDAAVPRSPQTPHKPKNAVERY